MNHCQDCLIEIHPLSNHTGHEKWCEECFNKGFAYETNEHWRSFWDYELSKELNGDLNEIK